MSLAVTVPRGAAVAHLPRPFSLTFGGELGRAALLYECSGPPDAPVVAVLGGISAGRHVASNAHNPAPGWFDAQCGRNRAIDTLQFRVLSFDYIVPENPKFAITSTDHARLLAHLLDHLQIKTLHAVAGASYGGMVALSFCEQFPRRAQRLAVLCAAHEPHPYATGFRGIQRAILEHDATPRGVALARALGMLTYRGPREFGGRFKSAPVARDGGLRFESVDYIDSRGADFARDFDADRYYSLSLAIDCHRADPTGISTPAFLFSCESDILVPTSQVRELQQKLAGPVEWQRCNSPFGHDAFLKEKKAVAEFLRKALASNPAVCGAREVSR
ncbi:MAG: homoserine O-succinyltransferase [Planctomycetes bacterium]|nr:homoserine O-succinyltransferase [Planctomycetota bacterium]